MPQVRVASPPIVEHLDIFKQALPGLLPGPVVLMAHQFILQRAEEALRYGIVETLALAAHTAFIVGVRQQLLIAYGAIGTALIRMDNNVLWSFSAP